MSNRINDSIDITVNIDVNEVLTQVSTEELIEELESRADYDPSGDAVYEVNPRNIKDVLSCWFEAKGYPQMWTYSTEEVLEIIRKELEMGI